MSDRLFGTVKAGSTSVRLPVLLTKTSDGTEQTGKVAADVTAEYWREGGSVVGITVSDLSLLTSAWASGGWKERGRGLYRLDVPDAAFAAGADWVTITVVVAGCFVYHERINIESSIPSQLLATPANLLATDGAGRVTVGANADKAGYGLAGLDSLVAHSGTAQAGAGNSITLAAGASGQDDIYVGSLVKLYGGTGAGQTRVITSYNGATKVAMVGRNWTVQPDATSSYAVLSVAVPRVDDSLRVQVQVGVGNGQLNMAAGKVPATLAAGDVTGNLPANTVQVEGADATDSIAALVPTAIQNADALLKRDLTLVTGEARRSPLNALRRWLNKVTKSGATGTVMKEDDTTPAWTAQIGSSSIDPD